MSCGFSSVAADSKSAIAACDNILALDADQIELDDWKSWPEGDQAETTLAHIRSELRTRAAGIQARAAEKKSRIEELTKLAEQQKAARTAPHQQPKAAEWDSKKSLLAVIWLVLVAVFVGRRIVERRRQFNHNKG